MSSPAFFPEGSEPRLRDTIWRILQKINGGIADGGGGGAGSNNQAFEIYPMGTAIPNNPSRPALRYTGLPPTPMEQWDVATQQWFTWIILCIGSWCL